MNGEGFQSVVVVPLVPVTINYFFWGQTWGPCICTAVQDGGIGGEVDQRSVYFNKYGCILNCADGSCNLQYAGHMLPTQLATKYDLFFMLQLAP
ncbi:hypothetical protein ES703_68605 [subsurface metagenome]